MWPWEHLAIGYLAYSIVTHLIAGRGPTAGGAVAVALGTQFPDLVDKPLGWGTTLLPSGQSLAHSLLLAVPVVVAVVAVGVRFGRRTVAVAFAVGYLSHLPGDVLYAAMLGGTLNLEFLLWPVIPAPATQHAMIGYVQELLADFASVLASPRGAFYLLFEVALVVGTVAVWVIDGTPGLPRDVDDPRGDVE